MTQEVPKTQETIRPRPSDSRKIMMNYIINFGREENPELPPQPVPITKIIEFENQQRLWFGPRVDAIDFIFARQILSVLRIDSQNNTLVYTGSHQPGKEEPQTFT